MSHTATVKIEFKNRAALAAVCQNLGLKFIEGQQQVKLYSETVRAEFSVKLPGWNYPIAICGDDVKYDNYNGMWGKEIELTKLQDQYSREVVLEQARLSGFQIQETEVDGEIVLNLFDYSEG